MFQKDTINLICRQCVDSVWISETHDNVSTLLVKSNNHFQNAMFWLKFYKYINRDYTLTKFKVLMQVFFILPSRNWVWTLHTPSCKANTDFGSLKNWLKTQINQNIPTEPKTNLMSVWPLPSFPRFSNLIYSSNKNLQLATENFCIKITSINLLSLA